MIRKFPGGHKVDRVYINDPDPDTFEGAVALLEASRDRLAPYYNGPKDDLVKVTALVWTRGDYPCGCGYCK